MCACLRWFLSLNFTFACYCRRGGWLGSHQKLGYVDRTEGGGLRGGSLRGELNVGEFSHHAPPDVAADVFV